MYADRKTQSFEVTPSLGREFNKDLQLIDILNAPNSDALLADLAVLSESLLTCRESRIHGLQSPVEAWFSFAISPSPVTT